MKQERHYYAHACRKHSAHCCVARKLLMQSFSSSCNGFGQRKEGLFDATSTQETNSACQINTNQQGDDKR